MTQHLIDTQQEIDALCRNLAGLPAIGVDTEFLRVRTYYPKLALVQVSTPDEMYCIDPLAPGLRLDALWAVMADPGVVKVMHAARQDIEVLLHTADFIPGPLFDTQIAAGLLGHGEQVGYARLVEAEFGTALPKGAQRTDWTRRPLSREQLGYAANDVRYLLPLYERMHSALVSSDRLDWAVEDCERLRTPDLYEMDPEQAFRRVGRGARLDPDAQQVLKALCTWREQTARARDLPRSWVVDDQVMVEIATGLPRTRGELASVGGLRSRAVQEYGDDIIACVNEARRGEAELWPRHDSLSPEQKALKATLVEVVQRRAAALEVAESVLITRADVTRIVHGVPPEEVVTGWRWREIGQDLAAAAVGAPANAGRRAG